MFQLRDDDFVAFVRAHRPSLVRFAVTMTGGDEHLAEDLVQAALVRIYLARPVHVSSAYGYARRAVANGLIDHVRRPFFRRERVQAELLDRPAEVPDSDVDPQLMRALASLPVRMRAAVVLRHVEGLSVEDTARLLRCSRGTVKSQTARGLDKLRAYLESAEADSADSSDPNSTSRAGRAGEESSCQAS